MNKYYKILIRPNKHRPWKKEAILSVNYWLFLWCPVRIVQKDVPIFVEICKKRFGNLMVIDKTKK